MSIAVFAGSFDPFTIGHLDIVKRASALCDKLVIGIGYNEKKPGEWTLEERLKSIGDLFKGNEKVEVLPYTGLTVDFARNIKADFLVRGIRGMQDFEFERNLADINKEIGNLETILLISKPDLSFVSSSMVRELIHNGYDVSKYIAGDFPIRNQK